MPNDPPEGELRAAVAAGTAALSALDGAGRVGLQRFQVAQSHDAALRAGMDQLNRFLAAVFRMMETVANVERQIAQAWPRGR